MRTELPYWERIRRLKKDFGLTEDDLVSRNEALSRSTLQALMRPYRDQKAGNYNNSRYPRPPKLQAVADALGVPPEEFVEYRLAKVREALDERTQGLDQAMAHYNEITEALDVLATQRLANGGRRPALLSLLRPASDDEPPTAQGEA